MSCLLSGMEGEVKRMAATRVSWGLAGLTITAFASLGAAASASAASAPTIESTSVLHVTQHSATLEAQINPQGSETGYEIWFWPGCSEGACERVPPRVVASAADIGDGYEGRVVTANLSELEPGVFNNEYWVVATNSVGRTEIAHQSFATPPAPSIEGESVSHVTQTDAMLEAKINPESLPHGALYQFQLVKNTNEFLPELVCSEEGVVQPLGQDGCLGGGGTPPGAIPLRSVFGGDEGKPVSLDLASVGITLQPDTTYHYRVLAAESFGGEDGVSWEPPAVIGPDQTFTTSPGKAPAIESESVSHLTSTDATLEAQINTEGLETSYQFRLISGCLAPLACAAITPYPLPSGKLLGSFVGQSVSVELNSAGVTLRPGERYEYWVTTTNAAGTTEGPHQGFTTPSEPPPGNAQVSGTGDLLPAIQSPPSASPSHHRRHKHHWRHKRHHRSSVHRARHAG